MGSVASCVEQYHRGINLRSKKGVGLATWIILGDG